MRRLVILFALLLLPASASAATWTVNSLSGLRDFSCGASAGQCTIRDALWEAADGDTINFDFSAEVGPLIISPVFAAISVTNSDLLIDGFDCTGCGTVTRNTNDPADGLNLQVAIALDGGSMFFADAPIRITGDRVEVRGFNIRGAGGSGVYIDADGVQVTECLIGTNLDGTAPDGNAAYGVHVDGDDDVIVGPWNVISGNGAGGIFVDGSGPDDGQIIGNLIGTSITAATAMGNGGDGITAISSSSNVQDGWIVGGAAVACAIGAAVTGGLSLSKHAKFEEVNDGTDPPRAANIKSNGQTLNIVTDVLIASAVVGAGVATALFFIGRPSDDGSALTILPLASPTTAGVLLSARF